MENKKFDQAKYMRDWQKENMKQVKVSYKTEFVNEFKDACKKLGIKQSDIFRKAMYETIKKAEGIKMTKEEIKQEIILDLEKAYEEKNECRYYLEQLPMEGDYDNEVHEYINNLENEIKHQNKEDFDYYVNQLVDYYYQNQKLYFYERKYEVELLELNEDKSVKYANSWSNESEFFDNYDEALKEAQSKVDFWSCKKAYHQVVINEVYFYDDEVQETEEIECFDIAY